MDILALVTDFKGLPVVTPALADVAGDIDVGRKCIATLMTPSPLQASQRPPLTLKLKRPGP
jgi:hypothetical protein